MEPPLIAVERLAVPGHLPSVTTGSFPAGQHRRRHPADTRASARPRSILGRVCQTWCSQRLGRWSSKRQGSAGRKYSPGEPEIFPTCPESGSPTRSGTWDLRINRLSQRFAFSNIYAKIRSAITANLRSAKALLPWFRSDLRNRIQWRLDNRNDYAEDLWRFPFGRRVRG